ncbi:MAG: CapA family protein [Methylocaldum sp.]|nr:CapA family protein [Methylocaldum sp.]
MDLLKRKVAVRCPGWDNDKPTRYFSQPYSLVEGLEWIYHVLINPPRSHGPFEEFVPDNSVINTVMPRIKLGFIGDIMILEGMDLRIGEDIRRFFSDTDFLVGNFEGTIVTGHRKQVFMAQAHTEEILDHLSKLFPPERTVLSCANNHTGDYGWDGFCESYRRLQDYGFITVGRRDEPSVLIDGKVNIVGCTRWSNQKCEFVATIDEVDDYFAGDAEFNILYPHWGYEMQLRPKYHQVLHGRRLLNMWDMIIGHHSHCPQPVELCETNRNTRLLAYSLGNFCSSENRGDTPIGIILKADIGPDSNGVWGVGRMNWEFIYAFLHKKQRCVELEIRRTEPARSR